MSIVVIQIKGQSLTEPSQYHFELVGINTQDAAEPMGIFHDVPAGTYKVKATFQGKTLEGEAVVAGDESPDGSGWMKAVTVWL